jgi:hypothetical protein
MATKRALTHELLRGGTQALAVTAAKATPTAISLDDRIVE